MKALKHKRAENIDFCGHNIFLGHQNMTITQLFIQ